MKKFSVLILLMVLAVVFVGCSSNQGGEKQPTATSSAQANELVFASESEFAGLNPLLEETNLDAFLFRGLMRSREMELLLIDLDY